MTNTELRTIQETIKFDAPSMAACLVITTRCYYNYLYGVNKIPSQIERAALELEQINRQFIVDATARIDTIAARQFPGGIMSEVEAW